MNSPTPACPACGSIRLEDQGEHKPYSPMISTGQSKERAKNTDDNFRRVADRYGLTDMNNKDGQAVKRSAPPPIVAGPTVNIGGYQVPLSQAGAGACVNMPGMAQKIPSNPNASIKKSGSMSKMMQMTRPVAEHKAKI